MDIPGVWHISGNSLVALSDAELDVLAIAARTGLDLGRISIPPFFTVLEWIASLDETEIEIANHHIYLERERRGL